MNDTALDVFTPATLAERWHCSEHHVRNMIERGELRAFRLGEKLLRIRIEAVLAVETGSNSEDFGRPPAGEVDASREAKKRTPAPRLDALARRRLDQLRRQKED